MKGTKALLFSSLILAFYGGINIIYCLLLFLGTNNSGISLFTFDQVGILFFAYLIFQGIVPCAAGFIGFINRDTPEQARTVYNTSWVLLIVYYTYFFTTYGAPWTTIVFYLGCIMVSLVYFHSARQNLAQAKEMGLIKTKKAEE